MSEVSPALLINLFLIIALVYVAHQRDNLRRERDDLKIELDTTKRYYDYWVDRGQRLESVIAQLKEKGHRWTQ